MTNPRNINKMRLYKSYNTVYITIFICIVCIIGIVIYYNYKVKLLEHTYLMTTNNNNDFIQNIPVSNNRINNNNNNSNNNHGKGRGDDVFLDIYKQPARNNNCSVNNPGNIPINIKTQTCGDDNQFRQVGILTPSTKSKNDETIILPLMGRPLFPRRDKWNFYTLNDKNNMIKLPVTINGRSGDSEYGCDNVYDGDKILVKGYNYIFVFTQYENEIMRYM